MMYKTSAAVSWHDAALLFIQSQDEWFGPIGVDITFWVHNKRRDIDGGVKLTLDTVAEALGFNDCMVEELSVHKVVRRGLPEETGVRVWQIG